MTDSLINSIRLAPLIWVKQGKHYLFVRYDPFLKIIDNYSISIKTRFDILLDSPSESVE